MEFYIADRLLESTVEHCRTRHAQRGSLFASPSVLFVVDISADRLCHVGIAARIYLVGYLLPCFGFAGCSDRRLQRLLPPHHAQADHVLYVEWSGDAAGTTTAKASAIYVDLQIFTGSHRLDVGARHSLASIALVRRGLDCRRILCGLGAGIFVGQTDRLGDVIDVTKHPKQSTGKLPTESDILTSEM